MYRLPFTWLRGNSFSLVMTGLAALAMGGCQPTGPAPDLTVDVTLVGDGTVTQAADGDMVTLTAVPDEGWVFDGWSGAQLSDPSANPLVVDATQIKSITANFIEPRPEVICGDGVVDRSEQCDDGNVVDGDDCSSTCQIETPAPPGCGDGVVNGTEQCDGGGETAFCNADCTTSLCGDGKLNTQADEECDDGNTGDGDGCAANCQFEPPPPPPVNCGNGILNTGEDCDGTLFEPTAPTSHGACRNNCTYCGNGAVDGPTGSETCDDGNAVDTDACRNNCTKCGDGVVNAAANEQCDDGNTAPGDGCGATCQNEVSGVPNDDCDAPIPVSDGTRTYNSVGATTDGPDEPVKCVFEFGNTNVEADIWYCYTATCTGTAMASLCGSDYDTKLAVYDGCGCPTAAPLACSDDDCGTGTGNFQSRVEFPATVGLTYLVRVGGFDGDQGNGRLTIGCNVDACGDGSGDCFAESPTPETPGCGDAACCASTCALDQFCCDVTWDTNCAGEASGICEGGSGFPACGAPNTRSCGTPATDNTPGCANEDCCNTVCAADPYCCHEEWDLTCVNEAGAACFLTCGPGAGGGGCHSVNATPGCDSQACCEAVCAEDPFCCETRWDGTCVEAAAASPSCPP